MVQKIPPPQLLTGDQFQGFNRWLLEVTAILNDQGEIDPNAVAGLPTAYSAIGNNSTDITTLFTIASLQSAAINALQAQAAGFQAQIDALTARAQVLNGVGAPAAGLGNVNDWYANIGGGVGARIYVKTAVATWTAFPF